MSKIKQNRVYMIPIVFIFIIMILNASAENVRGIFIPLFKNDFSISDTQISYVLTISSLGYILFTYIGGILCEKIGQKNVFILGFLSIISSLLMLGFTHSYILFLVAMFLMNVGLGLISIAINTIIPVLFISFQAVLMNLTHFCYGLGSTIMQRIAGVLLYKGTAWRTIYLVEAVLFFIVLILFIPVKIPRTHKSENKVSNRGQNIQLFKNKLVYFYMLGLGFYVFAELATGNWFINFIEQIYDYNKSKSSLYLALFFALFTFGRLVGGFIAEKLGYLKTVIGSLIIAFILYITGLSLGESGLIIISISGLFFAVTFPTVIITISKVFKENSTYATGIIVTATSSINMILNIFVGYLNDNIGVNKTFYLIPISLFISILFIFAIYKNVKVKTH